MPSRSHPSRVAGSTTVSGDRHPPGATPDDLERFAGRTRDGDIATLDDGGLLLRDGRDRGAQPVHVVEVDVGDDRDPTVPRMGRIEAAAQPHLHEREVEVRLREVAEDHGRQELELRRVAVAPGDAVRDGQDGLHVSGEVVDPDRPPVDDDALAVRDEVRLWGLADAQPRRSQGAPREGQHAALAVGAGDERPANGELRVTESPEEGAGAAEAHPDPEPAASGKRGEGLVVVEGYGAVGRWRAGIGHSRVSSSS